MLGLGYQGSNNADISCSLEGREIFVFFLRVARGFCCCSVGQWVPLACFVKYVVGDVEL